MSDDKPESLEPILYRLPEWMPKHESKNEELLAPIAEELDLVDEDVQDVYEGTKPELAPTTDLINELAKLVDVEQTTDSKEAFRAKTMVGFAMNTSQGKVSDVINELAQLLKIDSDEIVFRRTPPPGLDRTDYSGKSFFDVPLDAVKESDVPDSEMVTIFNRLTAAGFETHILKHGGLVYGSPEDYGTDTNVPTYGGLDSNGDPVSSGDEYSGYIDYIYGV